jgi:hypothetical protein
MFMCQKHWFSLPERMRKKLWNLYTPGQEVTKDPSLEYLDHALACINHVAALEERMARDRAESDTRS